MPRLSELKAHGYGALAGAVQTYGGFLAVSTRMGLERSYEKKPNGYWHDTLNVEQGLLQFVQHYGTPGKMPTEAQLKGLGHSGLASAMRSHGGYAALASRLGLELSPQAVRVQEGRAKRQELAAAGIRTQPQERYPTGHWLDFANVEAGVRLVVEHLGLHDSMPTRKQLEDAGMRELVPAISRHGGYAAVAARLGLRSVSEQKKTWRDIDAVENALREFISRHGTAGIMPSANQLRAAGEYSLVSAITRHGGSFAVAARLGLRMSAKRKPNGYWSDPSHIDDGVLEFVREHGTAGSMPTEAELHAHGYADLAHAIRKRGTFADVATRLGLLLREKSKPPGYWDDFANVELEVRAFLAKHPARGGPRFMPTHQEFSKAGYAGLAAAFFKHGGISAVATRLGLEPNDARAPQGHWKNRDNLVGELERFIEEKGTPGLMPTEKQVASAGYRQLRGAMLEYGWRRLARELGLTLQVDPLPHGYWRNFENVAAAITKYVEEKGTPGMMPSHKECLGISGGLPDAIARMHGGHKAVAERLGLALSPQSLQSLNGVPRGYYNDFSVLERELRAFLEECNSGAVIPPLSVFRARKRNDLWAGMRKHGGSQEVAAKLGLVTEFHQWDNWDWFAERVRECIRGQGVEGEMPTVDELGEHGISAQAVLKHGGIFKVAERLGVTVPRRKPNHYWDDFENLRLELLDFINAYGTAGVLPTRAELEGRGRAELQSAIYRWGGRTAVGQRLGLLVAAERSPDGYWDDFENVRRDLEAYIAQRGQAGTMPTVEELESAGLNKLGKALGKHGGLRKVAGILGLQLRELQLRGHRHASNEQAQRQPNPGSERFARLQERLLTFVAQANMHGEMPTLRQLREAGQVDLASEVASLGGTGAVARRLGLRYTMRNGLDSDTAANLEKTATYLQPLAETNRLSPAMIMVILRRSGVLDVQARCVSKLTEALMSGDRASINSAKAGLWESFQDGANAGDDANDANDANETGYTAEEFDDTAESRPWRELDPQLRSEFDGSILLSTAADGRLAAMKHAREGSVIRGLSTLGKMRLPLDSLMRSLFSKVLWETFYKSLHSWYARVPAAAQISASEVEQALLTDYPDYRHNSFVKEVCSAFTEEVAQAIAFAESLPALGWHGLELRLHQADAARRMAEVLSGRSEFSYIVDADEPGMGKTAAYLAAVCSTGLRRVLLVAPKLIARDTWVGEPGEHSARGEIARCMPPGTTVVRGMDAVLAHLAQEQAQDRLDVSHAQDIPDEVSGSLGALGAPGIPGAATTIYLLHYEELLDEQKLETLCTHHFDTLCLDEVHRIKQRLGQESTRRRSAVERLRSLCATAVGLTGTPLVNELQEPLSIFQVLSSGDPQFESGWLNYRRMADVADVFEVMLPHIIRRRKADVLLHLPGCEVSTVPIPLSWNIEGEVLHIHRWPRSRANEALVEFRKLLVEAKLPYILKIAREEGKLFILSYLTEDVSRRIAAYLEEALPGEVANIDGLVTEADRQAILNAFRTTGQAGTPVTSGTGQNNAAGEATAGKRILVGTFGTLGEGLTLFNPSVANTANKIVIADLPYTYAELEQGISRLYREGQKRTVQVYVPVTTITGSVENESGLLTMDECIWDLLQSKRELSDVAIDGRYSTEDASNKVKSALRRWLAHVRESGTELLEVERRRQEQSDGQRWRNEIGRLRMASAERAHERFYDREYTRQFLEHLAADPASHLSNSWLRAQLQELISPRTDLVDMGCGLNPLKSLPCHVVGVDRHIRPGQKYGHLESPPLSDDSADILVYSLSLHGTPSDLMSYFQQARRVLRQGGHLFIVEPAAAFSREGLGRFLQGLGEYGFVVEAEPKELQGQEGTALIALHLQLTGEMGQPRVVDFIRK